MWNKDQLEKTGCNVTCANMLAIDGDDYDDGSEPAVIQIPGIVLATSDISIETGTQTHGTDKR